MPCFVRPCFAIWGMCGMFSPLIYMYRHYEFLASWNTSTYSNRRSIVTKKVRILKCSTYNYGYTKIISYIYIYIQKNIPRIGIEGRGFKERDALTDSAKLPFETKKNTRPMKWKKYRAQKIASFREVMFFLSYNV